MDGFAASAKAPAVITKIERLFGSRLRFPVYLWAAASLDSVAARASLIRRPSSSLNPTSSAEASARLLFDSPADFASSRSAERRCNRALSSLAGWLGCCCCVCRGEAEEGRRSEREKTVDLDANAST